jgi:hypothetical protein
MPELRGTPTSIRTGSHAMGRGISANHMRNRSPEYLRPLKPTLCTLGEYGLTLRRMLRSATTSVSPRVLSDSYSLIFLRCSVQWNYGTSGNVDQARSLIAAIRASGFKYGIYSSPGVSLFDFILFLRNKTNFITGMEHPLWLNRFRSRQLCASLVCDLQ